MPRPHSLPSNQCVRSALSSVAKRPEPKGDHSPQSISKAKNAWSYTPSPSFLQGALGKHRGVFNSAVIYICQVGHIINVGCFSWGQSHCVGSLPVSPRSHATCRFPPPRMSLPILYTTLRVHIGGGYHTWCIRLWGRSLPHIRLCRCPSPEASPKHQSMINNLGDRLRKECL